MAENEESLKHLGADLDENFVLKFRSYCLRNDFKQKTLVFRLVEWWMNQDNITQEHIYRGRAQEALSQISEEVASAQAAIDDENAAESDSSKKKRKQIRRSSSKSA